MNFSESNIKIWSRIGSRATFGMIALELGKNIRINQKGITPILSHI